MDKFEIQRRIFSLNALLMLLIAGFILLDGATASVGHALLTSIGFFGGIGSDLGRRVDIPQSPGP
jgi:hypothetical protein